MANKEILDYPETSIIADDDYILLDSVNGGTSKVLANAFGSAPVNYIYNWDFTESLDDKVEGKSVTLGGGAVRTNEGVKFTDKGHRINFTIPSADFWINKIIEFDIAKFDFKGNPNYDINFFWTPLTSGSGACLLCYATSVGWSVYGAKTRGGTQAKQSDAFSDGLPINAFDGKTVKLAVLRTGNGDKFDLYLDDVFIGRVGNVHIPTQMTVAAIGSKDVSTPSNSDQSYDVTITGLRIYSRE